MQARHGGLWRGRRHGGRHERCAAGCSRAAGGGRATARISRAMTTERGGSWRPNDGRILPLPAKSGGGLAALLPRLRRRADGSTYVRRSGAAVEMTWWRAPVGQLWRCRREVMQSSDCWPTALLCLFLSFFFCKSFIHVVGTYDSMSHPEYTKILLSTYYSVVKNHFGPRKPKYRVNTNPKAKRSTSMHISCGNNFFTTC